MPRKPKQPPPQRAKRELRFPSPGPAPRFKLPPRDEQERARMQNELHDWEMRDLIHCAVHTNNPKVRKELASRVSWFLLADFPLRRPVRVWLSWVLNKLSDRGTNCRT